MHISVLKHCFGQLFPALNEEGRRVTELGGGARGEAGDRERARCCTRGGQGARACGGAPDRAPQSRGGALVRTEPRDPRRVRSTCTGKRDRQNCGFADPRQSEVVWPASSPRLQSACCPSRTLTWHFQIWDVVCLLIPAIGFDTDILILK